MDKEYEKYNDDFYSEMTRYQPNSKSYKFGLLAIVLNIAYLFIALNTMNAGIGSSIKILGNVVVLLLGFLSIEKTKMYNKKFSIVLIIFGFIGIIRFFYIPFNVLTGNTSMISDFAVKRFEGDSVALKSFYFSRGMTLAVILLLSAACFMTAGIIGYLKSVKLHKYLERTNETR